MKFIRWPLIGGLLHLVQGERSWAGPAQDLLAVPNVTAHPSTASVPITALLHNEPLLCGFNVPINGWRPCRHHAVSSLGRLRRFAEKSATWHACSERWSYETVYYGSGWLRVSEYSPIYRWIASVGQACAINSAQRSILFISTAWRIVVMRWTRST